MKLELIKLLQHHHLWQKRVSAMAIRPDMENVLDDFYKKDNSIDMEFFFVKKSSWTIRKLKI